MDLTLTRRAQNAQGIFSELSRTDTREVLFVTCEHSYQDQTTDLWEAKVPLGSYTCELGQHDLGFGPFETYEVTGVEGHTGILFHTGNTEMDSEGCILLGENFSTLNGMQDVALSRVAFGAFMQLQSGSNTFVLTVVDPTV